MSNTLPGGNMPAAEIDLPIALVERLLHEHHPDLAELPLTEVSHGWDNVLFRLGSELAVRLPRRAQAAELVANEQHWLPVLGPRLPLATPVPVRIGGPSGDYPWPWSVLPWFDGSPVWPDTPADQDATATALGRFLAVLHQPAPPAAPTNPYRGGPLATRDEVTRQRIDTLADHLDGDQILQRWEQAMTQPPWQGKPLWLHGDLHPMNVLAHDGRLRAVIDFGDITSGDPATDLAVGFSMFDGAARETFRRAADSPLRTVDDAMWARAEGWALSIGLAIMATSADNPTMFSLGEAMIAPTP